MPADQQVIFALKGVIFSLEQDGAPEAVDLLSQASRACPYEEIQNLAVEALGKLALNGSRPALNNLFHLAIYSEKADAIQVITAHHFQNPDSASRPSTTCWKKTRPIIKHWTRNTCC